MLRQSLSESITTSGTATASSDYNSGNPVVVFQPGTVTRTFDVEIIGDTELESNETFLVNITEAFARHRGRPGRGTILDDDTLLMLEELGPAPQQAAAFESLFFTRDPFTSQEYRRLA